MNSSDYSDAVGSLSSSSVKDRQQALSQLSSVLKRDGPDAVGSVSGMVTALLDTVSDSNFRVSAGKCISEPHTRETKQWYYQLFC